MPREAHFSLDLLGKKELTCHLGRQVGEKKVKRDSMRVHCRLGRRATLKTESEKSHGDDWRKHHDSEDNCAQDGAQGTQSGPQDDTGEAQDGSQGGADGAQNGPQDDAGAA
jgi:hypothetical protein